MDVHRNGVLRVMDGENDMVAWVVKENAINYHGKFEMGE